MGILKTIEKIATINAVEKLAEGAIMHTSKAIVNYMDKNDLRYIYVPQGAESYIGEHYLDVQTELQAHGFENINLLEKKVLHNVWINKSRNEKVISISINGRESFKKKQRFRSDDQIVIVYHTYRS